MHLSSAPSPTPVRAGTLPSARLQFSKTWRQYKPERRQKQTGQRGWALSLLRTYNCLFFSQTEKHRQHCQNTLGGFHGGVCGYYLWNFTISREGQTILELPGRSLKQLWAQTFPQQPQGSSGSSSTKTWGCCLGIHLSPEKAQRLQVMTQRSPGELQGMDLPSTKFFK